MHADEELNQLITHSSHRFLLLSLLSSPLLSPLLLHSILRSHLFCHQGEGERAAASGEEPGPLGRRLRRGQGLTSCLCAEVWSTTSPHHHCSQLVEEQVLEALMGAEGVVQKEAPPPCVPDEKKPSLSVEELEAKQGTTTQIPAGMGGAW